MHVGSGPGGGSRSAFDAGELCVDACGEVSVEFCGVGQDLERVAGLRDGRWEIRTFGAQGGAELLGGGGGHGGGQVGDRPVELEDEVPGAAEDRIECYVRGLIGHGGVLAAGEVGGADERDELV